MAKRVRNYRLEELARKARANALGFSGRGAQRGAIARREFPSAAEIRANTEFAVRKLSERKAQIVRNADVLPDEILRAVNVDRRALQAEKEAARQTRPPEETGYAPRTYQDEKSYQWSLRHSKKATSRYDDKMSRDQRDLYYRAFVDGWNLPHDERHWDDLYDYLILYWDFDPEPDSADWAGYPRGGK